MVVHVVMSMSLVCVRESFILLYLSSEIFPYLVMLIGLENVLVITKSVVSTPVHLDVKIRVAQGQWLVVCYLELCLGMQSIMR